MGEHEPDFGPVHLGFWTGTAFVPCLGDWFKFQLQCEHDDEYEEPGPIMLSLLRAVLDRREDFRPTLEAAIYRYYMREAFWDKIDYGMDDYGRDWAETLAPRDVAQGDIWRLLRDAQVGISSGDNDAERVKFDVTFTPTWEEEHGLQIEVERWTIVGIGPYGCCEPP